MRSTLVIAMLLAIISNTCAQDTLRGTIIDTQSHEGLPGVNIFSEKGLAAVSDINGKFFLAAGSCNRLEFRLLGFKHTIIQNPGQEILVKMSAAPSAMDEIVVTASRHIQRRNEVPLSIEKISAGVIAETKATGLREIINKVPGVVMMDLNNEQHGMSIRQPMGTSPYYLYMEDGIPLRTMGLFNHNALLEANLLSVSSIEVVKGPASSLYGPEAVGGAINLVTIKPGPTLSARAGMQMSDRGYRRLQFNTGGPLGKKIGFNVGGSGAGQRNSWMEYSDYDKNSLNARMDLELASRTKLIVSGSYNNYYSQTPGTTDSTAFYNRSYSSAAHFTYRQIEAARFRSTLQHQWSRNNSTELHVFGRQNSIRQNPAYAIRWMKGSNNARGEINNSQFKSKGAILQHLILIPLLKTRVLSGLSADRSPVNYNAYQVDLAAKIRPGGNSVEQYSIIAERPDIMLTQYDALLDNTAAFAQAEIKPIKSLNIVAGARYDILGFTYVNHLDGTSGQKSYQKFTPRIGATYKIKDNMTLYANYGQGFSPPPLTTIFTRKPGAASDEFYYELQPSSFQNYEAGGWSSFLNNRLTLSASLYQMKGRNELLNVRQADNSTMIQSAGKTLHRGVEYSLVFHPRNSLMIRVGGTNSVHRYEEFVLSDRESDAIRNVNGKFMPSAPSWICNAEFVLKPAIIKGLRLGLEWQHLSKWFQDQTNTTNYADKGVFSLEGVSLLHFRCGYEYRSFEVFCNILNLTNELYANNVTRSNVAGSPSTFTPGAPRTFVFGIQYNFTRKQ